MEMDETTTRRIATMSTAHPFLAETLLDVINSTKPLRTSGNTDLDAQQFTEHLLQLSGALQTSIELDTLLSIFSRDIKNLIRHDSLSYQHTSHALEFSTGKASRNRCSYTLDIEKESLGEITLTRKQKFTDDELKLLEKLLCVLLYPLRNAVLYHQALRAATKDSLTGLSNRRSMDEVISRETKLALRYKHSLSMIVLDIDHFKRINDSYGHKAGDCLIKALADILKTTARTTDSIFRYGGEEFVMLLPNTGGDGVRLLAERIRQKVEETECVCHGVAMKMTISLGISTLRKTDNEEALFLRADKALYKAKTSGRNQFCEA